MQTLRSTNHMSTSGGRNIYLRNADRDAYLARLPQIIAEKYPNISAKKKKSVIAALTPYKIEQNQAKLKNLLKQRYARLPLFVKEWMKTQPELLPLLAADVPEFMADMSIVEGWKKAAAAARTKKTTKTRKTKRTRAPIEGDLIDGIMYPKGKKPMPRDPSATIDTFEDIIYPSKK